MTKPKPAATVEEHKRAAATRHRLVRAMVFDPDLSPTECRVALAVLTFVNRSTGQAWPSQARLARELGLSDRQVRRALVAVERLGWLVQDRAGGGRTEGGRGRPNTYSIGWPRLRAVEQHLAAADAEGENPDADVHVPAQERGHGRPGIALDTRTSMARNPDIFVQEPGHGCPTNLFIEPIKEPLETAPAEGRSAASKDPEGAAIRRRLEPYLPMLLTTEEMATRRQQLTCLFRLADRLRGQDLDLAEAWLKAERNRGNDPDRNMQVLREAIDCGAFQMLDKAKPT